MTVRQAESKWCSTIVTVGDAVLHAQSLGEAGQPALVLLGGATWSRDWWADDLCAMFALRGLRVLRYDARDTGESTAYPPGRPGYTATDLADDVVAVLDAFAIARAVVLGLSMGGGLAQLVASRHPGRVDGLVLVSTSPADGADRDLPPPSAEILAGFESPEPDPDWSDCDDVVEHVINSERPYAGPSDFDEAELRVLAARVWARTPSMASAVVNHGLVAGSADPVDLSTLRGRPTLVVHGSDDPLFPLAHGQALASALDAPLLVLDGVGHQAPPPRTWDQLVHAVTGLVLA